MTEYKILASDEIDRDLFKEFRRRQTVTDCLRRENGSWVVKSDPFTDDWNEADYKKLISCLKNTADTGGLVCGAFINGILKGFVSVEGTPTGSGFQYIDLSNIYVSEDMRRQGIGRKLFRTAQNFAKERNINRLYISAHSAVESQAFYKAMGCTEAEEYDPAHVKNEPFDCQLECNA